MPGYVNPLQGSGWQAQRTDQGVDYDVGSPQPIGAIGNAVVTYSSSNQAGWPGGHFLIYQLLDGPHAGQYVFIAESITDLPPVGTRLAAGQRVATAVPGGLEMGFAAAPGTSANVLTPYNGAPDGTATSGGKAFARLLKSVGAPVRDDPGGQDAPWSGGGTTSIGAGPALTGGAGGAPAVHLTAAQFKAALGAVAGAIDSVPELKALLDKQLHAPGGGSIDEFKQDVENSHWYKTHADSARQQFALAVSDPATFKQNVDAMLGKIHRLAGQAGAQLKPGQDLLLARRALFENMDDQALQTALVQTPNLTGLKSTKGLTGQIAGYTQQLQQLASAYGQNWGPNQFAYRAQQIVAGVQTIDTYKNLLIQQAKSKYPGLSAQLDAGKTVLDLATPYVDSMSRLLELNPQGINWQTDPLIQKALQGHNEMKGSAVHSETIPVWQYENWIRRDPRWGQTNNAKASAASALMQLGKNWGFE